MRRDAVKLLSKFTVRKNSTPKGVPIGHPRTDTIHETSKPLFLQKSHFFLLEKFHSVEKPKKRQKLGGENFLRSEGANVFT